MSRYWPKRSSPEGFSIEKLAQTYRKKILSKQNQLDQSILATKIISKVSASKQNWYGPHWANRYYEEYREAA